MLLVTLVIIASGNFSPKAKKTTESVKHDKTFCMGGGKHVRSVKVTPSLCKVEHLITVAAAAADITPSKCEKAASSVKHDMTLQLGDKKYAKRVKFDPSPLMCEAVKLDNSSG